MIVQKILKGRTINSSKLIEIKILKSKSKIIRENKGVIYICKYKRLAGLFRKDIKETREFGRKTCNKAKKELKNKGFFTSDELPNYGISQEELNEIINKTNAQKSDLIVFFAYNEEGAEKTKDFLDNTLKKFCKTF